MKKVLEMREKRAKAWDAAKAFLDTRAKDGVLSAEDNATYAPTIAAGAYTVAFGDFQNYWIADRSGRTVRRADELHIANLQTGFYAFQRVDGKTVLPEGIKLLKQHA